MTTTHVILSESHEDLNFKYHEINYLNILFRKISANHRDLAVDEFEELIFKEGITIFYIAEVDSSADLIAIKGVVYLKLIKKNAKLVGVLQNFIIDPDFKSDDTVQQLLDTTVKDAKDLACEYVLFDSKVDDKDLRTMLENYGFVFVDADGVLPAYRF